MMPLVSVIVPNYNHAAYLKQRIDSILNQSFQDFELILLDDCSTDDSRTILNSYAENPHVSHVVYNDTNSGSPFAQWQKGISFAKGEWIWIAESDDWADKHFLETMLAEAKAYPTAGLLYTKATYVYPNGDTWRPKVSNKSQFYSGEEYIKTELIYANVIYNVSMTLFRKALVKNIDFSKFNQMRLCGDWFFYTLLCEKTNVLEVNNNISYYRMHGSNSSNDAEHAGCSYIEGFDVLDYIVLKYNISQRVYGRFWAKQLVNNSSKYKFSDELLKNILKILQLKYPLVYTLYIFETYKKKIHNLKTRLRFPKKGEVWCLHRVLPKRSQFSSNRELEITPDYFEQLIKSYKQKGYKFVPIESIVGFVSSIFKRKRINISFDDGFNDVYEYAFPILKREHIPFTLFLTTGMPEGTAHLWWLELEKMVKTPEEFESVLLDIYDSGENMSEYFCKKYKVSLDYSLVKRVSLSWEQIREMIDSGLCTIGSHTCSHPALTRFPEERIREELSSSKQQIFDHLGVEPVCFSYPHSMENPEVQALVKENGYKCAFMGFGGSIHKGDNPLKLNRKYILQS